MSVQNQMDTLLMVTSAISITSVLRVQSTRNSVQMVWSSMTTAFCMRNVIYPSILIAPVGHNYVSILFLFNLLLYYLLSSTVSNFPWSCKLALIMPSSPVSRIFIGSKIGSIVCLGLKSVINDTSFKSMD